MLQVEIDLDLVTRSTITITDAIANLVVKPADMRLHR